MYFNNSKKIKDEINRYFYNKHKKVKKYWQFEPLYSDKVQLNWVEQYYTQFNSILIYPRIFESREEKNSFMFRRSNDFMYNIMINLFIYFNNKMILSLSFNDQENKRIEKINIYNDVFVNLQNSEDSIKIPIIETIENIKDEKIKSSFKVLHGGDLLEHSIDRI